MKHNLLNRARLYLADWEKLISVYAFNRIFLFGKIEGDDIFLYCFLLTMKNTVIKTK
jgi:hypothetical protein